MVSVIQPVFNSALFLEEAIVSVLNQTFSDFEYIIINDGSTDQSGTIIEKFAKRDHRIRVYSLEQNKGYNYALNYGISYSTKEFIFRIDSDDILQKDVLEKRLSAFRNNHTTVLVSGSSRIFISGYKDKNVLRILPQETGTINWLLLFGNPVTHSSALFKRKLFHHCGKYDEQKNLEDWILWNKFKKFGTIVIQNYGDVYYRFHQNQSTSSNRNNSSFKKNVIKCINENLINLFGSNTMFISDEVIWASYYDYSFPDSTLKVTLSAINFLKKLKERYKELPKTQTKWHLGNEFDFYFAVQQIKILKRLNLKFLRIVLILFYLIKYFNVFIIANRKLTCNYLKYLYKIYKFKKLAKSN